MIKKIIEGHRFYFSDKAKEYYMELNPSKFKIYINYIKFMRYTIFYYIIRELWRRGL